MLWSVVEASTVLVTTWLDVDEHLGEVGWDSDGVSECCKEWSEGFKSLVHWFCEEIDGATRVV